MRDIRFRAWDKKEKKMLSTVTGMHIAVVFENPKRFEIMQYTGLKDINGKEIYEGDIVKYSIPKASGEYKGIGEVFWRNDGQFRVRDYFAMPELNSAFMEVIGNIYENPELLK